MGEFDGRTATGAAEMALGQPIEWPPTNVEWQDMALTLHAELERKHDIKIVGFAMMSVTPLRDPP
jgi:hypothetical protein